MVEAHCGREPERERGREPAAEILSGAKDLTAARTVSLHARSLAPPVKARGFGMTPESVALSN